MTEVDELAMHPCLSLTSISSLGVGKMYTASGYNAAPTAGEHAAYGYHNPQLAYMINDLQLMQTVTKIITITSSR